MDCTLMHVSNNIYLLCVACIIVTDKKDNLHKEKSNRFFFET